LFLRCLGYFFVSSFFSADAGVCAGAGDAAGAAGGGEAGLPQAARVATAAIEANNNEVFIGFLS